MKVCKHTVTLTGPSIAPRSDSFQPVPNLSPEGLRIARELSKLSAKDFEEVRQLVHKLNPKALS
jgi:hypothetical protein